ncbi:serine/threonine protein phosphatase [Sphingomonas glacialis]|uniref:Serine/threonine protein phosphatase n=1 Tax=Sphingomonas glacialis TaxID=658225 RepID=A0A502FYX9_9SPHN|nr:serine/threonine protein phosphatase [Sphingomonas glacialis]
MARSGPRKGLLERVWALFGRRSRTLSFPSYDGERPSAIPPGRLVYAIGDIHACADLFWALLDRIADDTTARMGRAVTMIVLGDIIDRGPDSEKMLRTMHQLSQTRDNVIVIRGNHEQMLLDVLDGSYDALALWLRHGGREFLGSFAIDEALMDPDRMRELIAALQQAIAPPIVAWLRSLPFKVRIGDYLFVHAGIRPGVPIEKQEDTDLLWIRDAFLDYDGPHQAVIVHGHTIVESGPEMLRYRIGVDTGAYRTGILTAVGLAGEDRWIIQNTD